MFLPKFRSTLWPNFYGYGIFLEQLFVYLLHRCVIADALLSDPTVVQSHSPRLTTDDIACKLLSDVPWAAKDRTLVSLLVSELRIIVTTNITHLPVTDYNVTITSSYIVVQRQQLSVFSSSVI